MKRIIRIIAIALIAVGLYVGLNELLNKGNDIFNEGLNNVVNQNEVIDEKGHYTSKEDVALYIHTYNRLPDNYISKNKARQLGWVASKGNLQQVCKGCSIGGDKYNNYENILPSKNGRQYYECDIDYDGGKRNAKRIVFSNDGLIYYTGDHYKSFELLYGEP